MADSKGKTPLLFTYQGRKGLRKGPITASSRRRASELVDKAPPSETIETGETPETALAIENRQSNTYTFFLSHQNILIPRLFPSLSSSQIMSRDTASSSSRLPTTCHCQVPLALKKSWTNDNPGRRFLACKFYNPDTKYRGCGFFKWYDQHQSDWQKDIINELVLEKKLSCGELKMERSKNQHMEEHVKMLMEENDILRMKAKYVMNEVGSGIVVSTTNKKSTLTIVVVATFVLVALLCLTLMS